MLVIGCEVKDDRAVSQMLDDSAASAYRFGNLLIPTMNFSHSSS
jgi:hypothetical protein